MGLNPCIHLSPVQPSPQGFPQLLLAFPPCLSTTSSPHAAKSQQSEQKQLEKRNRHCR